MAKMSARLLVVDQDARYGEWLKHHLGVLCPESPVSVLQLNDFERWSQDLSGRDCDVLMLAASFGSSPEDPKAQGLDLLRQLREKPHFPAVIAVAEEGMSSRPSGRCSSARSIIFPSGYSHLSG